MSAQLHLAPDRRVQDRADGEVEAISGHTHLVVISSRAELDEVQSFVVGFNAFWIGLSDLAVEGTFAWATEEPIVPAYPPSIGPPWGSGEPNDADGLEDCAAIQIGEAFNDDKCPFRFASLCECDGFEAIEPI